VFACKRKCRMYDWSIMGPRVRPSEPVPPGRFVPHPDTVEDVRAGLEEAKRGELLSEEESAAYLRSLLGDEPSGE